MCRNRSRKEPVRLIFERKQLHYSRPNNNAYNGLFLQSCVINHISCCYAKFTMRMDVMHGRLLHRNIVNEHENNALCSDYSTLNENAAFI